MKTFGSAISSVFGSMGFSSLFAGILLFGFETHDAFAQQQPGQPYCWNCPCNYPNSGWCEADPDPCSFTNGACGCNTFAGCSPVIAPTQPIPTIVNQPTSPSEPTEPNGPPSP